MKKSSILLCMGIFVSSMLLYFVLPHSIPIHFNLHGEIDAFSNKAMIFMFPTLSLLTTGILLLTRKIDPKKKNYIKFEKPFYTMIFIINLFLLGIMLLFVMESFFPKALNVNIVLCFLLGMLFMVIGNIMPKFKSNYLIGIRTPWTLANEDVWLATHRIGGKIFFVGGLALLLIAFVPEPFYGILMLSDIIIIAILPILYSYFCFRDMEKAKNEK